jgi:hypothetical protein
MSKRFDKLRALANDPAASPQERATAERLLSEMQSRGESGLVVVALRESWEKSLLMALAHRHRVAITLRSDDVVLNGERSDDLLVDLTRLYPVMEHLIVSAAAGFLAAQFPDWVAEGDVPPGTPDLNPDVTLAAFRLTQAQISHKALTG